MPLIIPAAPTPPNLSNPATFENQCSAFLAWFASVAGSMSGSALLMADILGTVSHSGGVPTGAIMEWGSNANGTYLRLADGMQFCALDTSGTDAIATASGNLFTTASDLTWTYPVTFTSVLFAGGTLVRADRDGGISLRGRSNSAITYRPWTTVSLSAGVSSIRELFAMGRWR